MLRTRLAALTAMTLMLASTNGCVTSKNVCGWAKPILPSRADVLTDGTARQILTHNETGASLCGWRPYSA